MGILRLYLCLLVALLFSGCAVLSNNSDLVLTKNIQAPTILEVRGRMLRRNGH